MGRPSKRMAEKGTITRAIAEEGGVQSVMWAGPRKKNKPARIVLEADFEDLSYRIEIGLPRPTDAALALEPLVKLEELSVQAKGRRTVLMKRAGPSVFMRDEKGRMQQQHISLLPSETALAGFRGGAQFPELSQVQTELLDWRFYHDFRTDDASPIRTPTLGVCAPTLNSHGENLAAVFATVYNISEAPEDIMEAIEDAFPGCRLMTGVDNGQATLAISYPDEFGKTNPPIR